MISVRPTKFRFTIWTAAALLAVIVALALPQSALAAPDRPMGLTATALDHDTVSLTWSHPDEENVDHYRVLRRTSAESRLSQIATTQTTSFQDDGLQPETKYTYRVKAVDSDGVVSGRSVRSQTTTAPAPSDPPEPDPTPEPEPDPTPAQPDKEGGQEGNATPRSSHIAAPANLRVSDRTITSVTFAWDATTDSAVTHTYISYSYPGVVRSSWQPGVLSSFTIASVPQNTAISFTVGWATSSGGQPGRVVGITARTLADKQAQNLEASEITAESAKLTWDNPTGYDVTGYELDRRTGNGSFTTLVEGTGLSTGLTDTTVSASTTYTYSVTIKYVPAGETTSRNGNAVDLDVTTPGLSGVGAPINFRITNATLTNGVYVLANHDDDPILDWEYSPTTIRYPHPDGGTIELQGYDETGYKFTRKWTDSDATCGANCPWLLVALQRGTGHTYFTDRDIAPGTYTFRIRALDEDNNPGAAAEITVRLPDASAFVPGAPTNVSVTSRGHGRALIVEGSWDQVWLAPAYLVQWKSGDQDYNTAATGNRSLINAWSGRRLLGADGNDQWSPAWHKFYSRQSFPYPGIKDLGFRWNKTYTIRVGMCLTTACDLDDVVFASERTLAIPMEP